MITQIETPRTYLRQLTASDAVQAYADWLNDSMVNEYLETRHVHQTVKTCEDFIQNCNADPCSHLFGIFLRDSDAHIGNAKLGFINQTHARGELSMFIGVKSCWGKGFATEVVRSITEYGFEHLGLERIQAGCYEEHIASLSVFKKVGYQVEGLLREHVISNGHRTGCFWLGILKNELTK